MPTGANLAPIAPAGKYLSFLLDGQEYAVEILKVQEIDGMMEITRVPSAPGYVRGLVNLRGRILPVACLRRRFGMAPVPDSERTCIVVVQVAHSNDEVTMGVVVDEVSEVLNLGRDQIEPPPPPDAGREAPFVSGLGKLDHRVVILLDLDRVFAGEEMDQVARTAP